MAELLILPASSPRSLSMIDQAKLERALRRLELQYANCRHVGERPERAEIDRGAIAESVIQRFETAYDTLWKDLKRHLIDALGLPDVPDSPKPILKLAGENDLCSLLLSPPGFPMPMPAPPPRMTTAGKEPPKLS